MIFNDRRPVEGVNLTPIIRVYSSVPQAIFRSACGPLRPKSAMAITLIQQDMDFLVQRASEILKAPGKAVVLDWQAEQALLRAATREKRHGLVGCDPLLRFTDGHGGREVVAGMDCYRLTIDGHTVRVVKILDQLSGQLRRPMQDFCVVAAEHYVRFYRFLRRKLRHTPPPEEPAPVMPEDHKARLWDNSIGFLTRGRETLKRYGVPQKRGILMMGEPGNGKTMACRWLMFHCRRLGFAWQHVGPEEYERARSDGMANELFELDEPGMILFDDFDLGVRNRDDVGPSTHHSIFLGELDGVEAHQGVVYLFTSNARLSELDSAFLRPGRIDQVLHFPRPAAELRRRLIREFWHREILQALDVERLVAETDGLSFAELTELKKLLVLHFLDAGKWDWSWAWQTFHADARYTKKNSPPIGFCRASSRQRPSQAVPEHMLNRLPSA